eukprot:Hpha_TRINITY_DN8907_c0_g1::TRINITY_DN8907_c0_g1_i1::g.80908::m.80908
MSGVADRPVRLLTGDTVFTHRRFARSQTHRGHKCGCAAVAVASIFAVCQLLFSEAAALTQAPQPPLATTQLRSFSALAASIPTPQPPPRTASPIDVTPATARPTLGTSLSTPPPLISTVEPTARTPTKAPSWVPTTSPPEPTTRVPTAHTAERLRLRAAAAAARQRAAVAARDAEELEKRLAHAEGTADAPLPREARGK